MNILDVIVDSLLAVTTSSRATNHVTATEMSVQWEKSASTTFTVSLFIQLDFYPPWPPLPSSSASETPLCVACVQCAPAISSHPAAADPSLTSRSRPPMGQSTLRSTGSRPTTPSSPRRSRCLCVWFEFFADPSYDDIVANSEVTYVAGGAAQNAARAASYVLPEKSVAYIGSVGDDDLKNTLQKVNETEGVISAYEVQPAPTKTGACAVILSNHDRSLVTTLRAAEMFHPEHLKKPEVAALIDGAKYFYIGGFFLTHGIESALEVAKAASSRGKTVVLNLSAPFIAQFFKVQLEELLPHVDILIGNESEAAAYAEAAGLGDAKPEQIASTLAVFSKSNASRPRVVVITQGPDSTLVASSSPSTSAANLSPEDPNPKVSRLKTP